MNNDCTLNDTFGHAQTAAYAKQRLNRETSNLDSLLTPPHVSEVVQSLTQLTDRLPQTLDQLAAALRRQHAEGLVRMDDGSPAGPAAEKFLHHLGEARLHARTLSDSLHKAASPLFHMGSKGQSA
ncbi:hypothetical protein [Streptomyces sp. NPDC048442]|uniref:hypothetical protein n=1 Tax=Streptomyces sp. NPDC048442 TaxID=3154823 RepID=UPI00341B159E